MNLQRRHALLAAAVTVALPALGQPARTVARVGLLSSTLPSQSGAAPSHYYEALWTELRSRGWIEGKNLVIEARYAEGRAERFPVLAAELVDARVDVIVAVFTAGVEAARNATRHIPIVMVGVPDPVGQGYIASLARPGGNITGLDNMASIELPLKHLEFLLEIAPGATTVGVLWSPVEAGSANAFEVEKGYAEKRGLRLVSLPVSAPEDIDRALELGQRERIQGLHVHPAPVNFPAIRKIAAWAAKQRLPSFGGPRSFAEAGLLLSYNPDYAHAFRLVARYVDRILRGANPAEMPVEQPTKFLLVVNLKTAKAIGITLPQSVLLRADEVIE